MSFLIQTYLHSTHGEGCHHCEALMNKALAKLDRVANALAATASVNYSAKYFGWEGPPAIWHEAVRTAYVQVLALKKDIQMEWRERQESWL